MLSTKNICTYKCQNTQLYKYKSTKKTFQYLHRGHLIKCKYNHCQSGHTITLHQWSIPDTRRKTENKFNLHPFQSTYKFGNVIFSLNKNGEISEGFENDLPTFQNVQFPTISINSPSMLGFPRNSFDSCISISHFNKISSKCTNPDFSKPTNPDFLSRHHNLFYWIITRQNYKCNFAISNTCTTL